VSYFEAAFGKILGQAISRDGQAGCICTRQGDFFGFRTTHAARQCCGQRARIRTCTQNEDLGRFCGKDSVGRADRRQQTWRSSPELAGVSDNQTNFAEDMTGFIDNVVNRLGFVKKATSGPKMKAPWAL
jgi:hypothetical protein